MFSLNRCLVEPPTFFIPLDETCSFYVYTCIHLNKSEISSRDPADEIVKLFQEHPRVSIHDTSKM